MMTDPNLFLSVLTICLRSAKKWNKILTKKFNSPSHHNDDLISINSPKFNQFLKDIYLREELVGSGTPESITVVPFLIS